MKKILLMALLMFGTARPISQSEAYLYTGVTGLAGVGITYYQFKSQGKIPLLWAMGSAAITGLVWWITDSLTPEGRYKTAKKKVESIRAYPLSMRPFASPQELKTVIFEELYVTSDVPLALAFNKLTALYNQAQEAIELLSKAYLDTSDNVLKRQFKNLVSEINAFKDNITKALKIIRADERYTEQAKLAEQRDFAKQQLAIQQSMAHAQWHQALKR